MSAPQMAPPASLPEPAAPRPLIARLLDRRARVPSGSYEMAAIDEALARYGIEPWRVGFVRGDL